MTNTTGTKEPMLSVHPSPPSSSFHQIVHFFHICDSLLFFPLSSLQLKKIRSLLVAGASTYDCFFQHLRLLDGAFKLSAKDLRSQVVREACITVA